MPPRVKKPLLSSLIREIGFIVQQFLDSEISEFCRTFLYALVYWFHIWFHRYNMKYTKKMFDMLNFIIIDLNSMLLNSQRLVSLLTYILHRIYILNVRHLN
ncbi:hypothetical protein KM1_192170 [Entamoeba histolytica HM-3:IMSS]|uniref:Uncharacterized protein n=1 Tax=Entamoeba histolytica HM-3:IMSS TaxID=885315 RepID=M7W5H4_ENTHI|nr:hypothetical protein KM1_192170 [Entamoeba histolytica HM-3:IMSS]